MRLTGGILEQWRNAFSFIQIMFFTSFQGSSWTLQAEQMDGDLVSYLFTGKASFGKLQNDYIGPRGDSNGQKRPEKIWEKGEK